VIERKIKPVSQRTDPSRTATSLPPADDEIECGPIWLSPHDMCELRVHGNRVPMSETQLKMLASLIRAAGRIISREELVGRGSELGSSQRSVDIQISRIRLALGPLGRHIIAVRRRGYRIDVRALSQSR
jgi:DNA-binding response OmpR family regulator